MYLLRPAQPGDLSDIERLAQDSGPMVCTLPAKRTHLTQKIERSLAAFAEEVEAPGKESYFFVLEDVRRGCLVGTGAVNALAGCQEPFYALRNDVLIHSSRALNVHSRIQALTLNHDLSDHSQLCSFYVAPELYDTPYASLVTLGRLLFMSAFPMRFSDQWLAVMPGIADADGRAPFWEHVGRKFFGMDYNQVEYYNGTRDKTFIAELMPHHPLYVPLLAKEAQQALGQVHEDAALQFRLLSDEGFEADKYVEIFDAGAIMTARRDTLSVWHGKQHATLVSGSDPVEGKPFLIGFMGPTGFHACITSGQLAGGQLILEQGMMEEAGLEAGQLVWLLSL